MVLRAFENTDGKTVQIETDQVAAYRPGDDPTYFLVTMQDGTQHRIVDFPIDFVKKIDPHGHFDKRQ